MKQFNTPTFLALLALMTIIIIAFAGSALILTKMSFQWLYYGKLMEPLANYILREEPWEFGWYIALIFINQHTIITIRGNNK